MTIQHLPVLAITSLLLASACSTSDDVSSETSATDVTTAESSTTVASSAGSAATGPDVADESSVDESNVDAENGVLGLPTTYLGDYTLVDEVFGTEVTVTVSDGVRTIDTNALPNHETGEFPNSGNPNAISAQDASWSFPAEPTWTGIAADTRVSGVALNGVKFEPGTAETISCSSGETLRIEALQGLYDLGFDMNNAHVQPTGEYHYHGISPLLVDAFDDDSDLVLLGFAADGHLMVYSKSGAYQSGYSLVTEPRTGTDCTPSLRNSETIDLAGTTPDGTYTSDWEYSVDTGTLDECNGTTIDGTYVYVVTDEYPFISRCLFGEVGDSDAPPMGAGAPGMPADGEGQAGVMPPAGGPNDGAAPPAPDGLLDLDAIAATLGVTVDELRDALGTPPPDLEAAAAQLGVTVDELQEALGPPPG